MRDTKSKTKVNLPAREEVRWFRRMLGPWYLENRREFLWRSVISPYIVCLSEIFLQQTSAKRVNDFMKDFKSKFPDWESLARAPQSDIEQAILPLGLYRQRSSKIYSLAQIMVKLDHFPCTRKGLENLPGIGQYIANVLLCALCHKRVPFLDVNMSRVLERFFGPRRMADIRYDPYLQRLASKVINVKDPLEANWMILDFAAIVCTKRTPRHFECPLSNRCYYYNSLPERNSHR